jgi:hypothetical protein
VVLLRRPLVAVLLVTPTMLAYLLAVLQVAPLGDRTDIYLYPSLALLAAIAFQELPFTRPEFAVTGAAVLAVAVAATLPHPDPYQLLSSHNPNRAPTAAGPAIRLGTPGQIGSRRR